MQTKLVIVIRTTQCCLEYEGLSGYREHRPNSEQTHSTCGLSEKPKTERKTYSFSDRRNYSPTDSGDQRSTTEQ